MSYLCAALAFLFAFVVLTPHATVHVEPALVVWSSR